MIDKPVSVPVNHISQIVTIISILKNVVSVLSCTHMIPAEAKAGQMALLRVLRAFLRTSWIRTLFLMVFIQNSAPWVELDTWKRRFIFGFCQEELETRDWHLCSH